MSPRDERLHLRVPKELKDQIQDYATRHRTTISALVVRFFNGVLQEEERLKRQAADAEQI